MANSLQAIADKKKEALEAKHAEDVEQFARKVAGEVLSNVEILNENIRQQLNAIIVGLAQSVAETIVSSNTTLDENLKDNFSLLLAATKNNEIDLSDQNRTLKNIGENLSKLDKTIDSLEMSPNITFDGFTGEQLKSEIDRILAKLPSDSKRLVSIAYENATPDKYLNVRLTDGIKFYSAFGGGGGGGTLDGATTIKQDEIIQALDDLRGFQIPEYDEIELTYVTSGNGAGEIETVIYKVASSAVATLTLSYDSSDRLSGVVFS